MLTKLIDTACNEQILLFLFKRKKQKKEKKKEKKEEKTRRNMRRVMSLKRNKIKL